VIIDFESDKLDLKNPKIFRKFSKTIGSQREEDISLIEKKYNSFRKDRDILIKQINETQNRLKDIKDESVLNRTKRNLEMDKEMVFIILKIVGTTTSTISLRNSLFESRNCELLFDQT
jgi:uncharacterized protein involved in exopolysaccharide biosynthesis